MLSHLLIATLSALRPPVSDAVDADRSWDVLPADADASERLAIAGQRLGSRSLNVAGAVLDGGTLIALSRQRPLVRSVREHLRLPVDVGDLILFLDDYLEAPRSPDVVIPPGRARSAGILLHPQDVFRDEPREYGGSRLALAPPASQEGLRPPRNGALLGPRWAARYQQPEDEAGRMAALAAMNPSFAERVGSLITQLRDQGATVVVESTVRDRRRGYLLYGSYLLSRADSAKDVRRRVKRLRRLNRRWRLKVPIRWRHPKGWRATIAAATQMAETYGVDYATERGARKSDHYDGEAIDLWAVGLPRQLKLHAPDGTFLWMNLSGDEQSRDLSLTPELIDWIEAHFELEKLRRDYPHWKDARAD